MNHCKHMAERFEGWENPPKHACCNLCTSVRFEPPGERPDENCNVCRKKLPRYATNRTCGKCLRKKWQQRSLTDSYEQARLSPYQY